MKRYIDFVQKPKNGQLHTEGTATFISVPEKKPVSKPVAPKPVAKPVAAKPAIAKPAVKPVAKPSTPVSHPHFRPDFGPIRKKPLGQPITAARPVAQSARPATQTVARPATQTVARPVTKPATRPTVSRPAASRTSRSMTDMIRPSRPVTKPAAKPAPKPVARPVEKPVENFDDFSDFDEPVDADDFDSIFGIIEDYHPTKKLEEAKKRPLSTPGQCLASNRALEDSAKEAQIVENQPKEDTKEQKPSRYHELLKSGKSPFIRTGALEKRPLSNSVAQKKPATPKAPKEELSDPATIIEKPEKDAHIGIIVTVVLTIVFGAAIGTAAFLLLPK